jgi:hypothetical protein
MLRDRYGDRALVKIDLTMRMCGGLHGRLCRRLSGSPVRGRLTKV